MCITRQAIFGLRVNDSVTKLMMGLYVTFCLFRKRVNLLTLKALTLFYADCGDQRGFFQFEIIINVS